LPQREIRVAVEMRADDLVENAGVDHDTDRRDDTAEERRDRCVHGPGQMAILHERDRDRVYRGDRAEHDECRTRDAPKLCSVGAERDADDICGAKSGAVARRVQHA
jgi:hypothetical protein